MKKNNIGVWFKSASVSFDNEIIFTILVHAGKRCKVPLSALQPEQMKSTVLKMPFSSISMVLLVWVLLYGSSVQEIVAKHQGSEPKVKDPPEGKLQVCERKKMPVTLTSEGCEPRDYKIHYCTGSCQSSSTVHVPKGTSTPTVVEQCHCCRATQYTVKKRRLAFNCDGVMTNRTIFLPIISQCGCHFCG